MAGKKAKKEKAAPEAPAEDGVVEEGSGKPKGSKKMLFAAIGLCLLSLGGGFFFARTAFMKDAEAYEPDYITEADDEEEMAEGEDGKDEKKGDDKKGKGEEKAELRDDIKDPLAKDGHDAEKAVALQKTETDKGEADQDDDGMLEFGDMLTNIAGTDADGRPKTSFLKVNLVMAYRTDPGAGALMREREAFIRDLFNGYLRGLTETDVQGMAGILYVKAELLKRARAAAGNDLPQEILIKDLIVQ